MRPVAEKARAHPAWRLLLLGTTALSACFPTTLPLGGISPMQGRPLPARSFQLGFGMGRFPDLMGAVPDMGTNPVPDGAGTTNARLVLTAGAGLGEWVDVGISSSRGLYSTVKLVRAGALSLSVSPAYYRATEEDETLWIRASNRNLTGMLAFQPGDVDGIALDLYAGSGINWFTVEIRDRWRRHSGRSPTLFGGLTIDLWRPSDDEDEVEAGREGLFHTARLSLESTGAWVTQRNGRRDFVTVGRIQMSLRSWPAW
jgi:hypothetical protein